jgi:hypothetical protein
MTHDYWHPLFGSVNLIKVSFLSPAAVRRLLTEPSPDFDIDYDSEAIEQIIALTNGQPLLVQLIGHSLVTKFNRETYDAGVERERRFTPTDIQDVIAMPEFYLNGNAYFTGIWVQAEQSAPAHQPEVLQALCQGDLALGEIAAATELPKDSVRAALETLQRHDVVTERDGKYDYTVELMRYWVARRRADISAARNAGPPLL